MAARATKLKRGALAAATILCVGLFVALTTLYRPAPAGRPGAADARRIVSLVPALTEMLFAMGAGAQVVGVSSYDDFPDEVRSRPRVGALLDPDVERILSLEPDLVLVYGSQTDLAGQFARAGIRVYAYRHGGIANVLGTIRDLGRLTGHAAEAERLAGQLQADLDSTRARVAGRPAPRTMVVMGRDAMALRGVYASAGVGFLHELLGVAGGEDVFADVAREGVQPSNETLLTRAPDVIIELHAGDEPAPDVLQQERAVWSLLPSLPAVRNSRVHLLYGSYLMSPGPRLARAAEVMARVLHPDAYR